MHFCTRKGVAVCLFLTLCFPPCTFSHCGGPHRATRGGVHTEKDGEAAGKKDENVLVQDLTGHTLIEREQSDDDDDVSMLDEKELEPEVSSSNAIACCATKIRGPSSGADSRRDVPDHAVEDVVEIPSIQAVDVASAKVVAEEGHSRDDRDAGRYYEDFQQDENARRFAVKPLAFRDAYTTPQSKAPGLSRRQLAGGPPPGSPPALMGTPPGTPPRSPPSTPWGTPPSSPFASPFGTPPGTPPLRPPPPHLSLGLGPSSPGQQPLPPRGPAEGLGSYLGAAGTRFARRGRRGPRFQFPGRRWLPGALGLGLRLWRLSDGWGDPWWIPGPRQDPPYQEGVERLMAALQRIQEEQRGGGGGGGPPPPPPPPPPPTPSQ